MLQALDYISTYLINCNHIFQILCQYANLHHPVHTGNSFTSWPCHVPNMACQKWAGCSEEGQNKREESECTRRRSFSQSSQGVKEGLQNCRWLFCLQEDDPAGGFRLTTAMHGQAAVGQGFSLRFWFPLHLHCNTLHVHTTHIYV